MKKLYMATVLITTILLVSGLAAASVKEAGIFESKGFTGEGLYKRVIADHVDEDGIESLKRIGCLIKHKLEHSVSFECPENIVSKLKVRESRIFRIMDLDADKQIRADLVWAEGIMGNGISVAILDTGIDTDHPELQDSYLGGYDYINDDPVPEDDHGHGTHVAGIITSNGADSSSKGVAPSAGIYMYKVCDADGYCYEDDMMAAMEAAVQADARVMSISIGGGSYTSENCDSDSLAAKVNWVVSQGLTVVVAAGNNGKGVSSPGCASGAIAVGAVDGNNNVVYWSGRGPALDIVSPGYHIYSTLIDGYGDMSGTSMATPNVAGVAALLLDTEPTLTDSEIKNALYTTASPVNKCYGCMWFFWGRCYGGSQEVACTPEITGAGVVNAYEAYLAVKSGEPELDSDGDGVPDSQDACPSNYGTYCNGCPEPSCFGCESPHCPATGQPYCLDDDSNCEASNAIGTCSSGECFYECYYGYDNCNSDWSDGCEVDIFSDNNCGGCGNACGEADCPESGCGVGDCGEEEYGTYPSTQQTSCLNGTCSGECTATCEYDPVCDPDDDNDGVLDSQDACPSTYGTDCNGCPNPCSGCAVMYCPASGEPACEPGTCPDTACPANGCGVGTCEQSEYGTYTPADNTCEVIDNVGTCTENPCTLECEYSETCGQPTAKCWSSEYKYLKRSSTQLGKFCRCAQGTYGYESYGYTWGKRTAYQYVDAGDNENWETEPTSNYFPAYRVRCNDGNWYYTNQDYFYG